MSQANSTNTTGVSGVGGEGFYLPTDVTPEQIFQAIGRLRKEARDEIDRLVRFLDETEITWSGSRRTRATTASLKKMIPARMTA